MHLVPTFVCPNPLSGSALLGVCAGAISLLELKLAFHLKPKAAGQTLRQRSGNSLCLLRARCPPLENLQLPQKEEENIPYLLNTSNPTAPVSRPQAHGSRTGINACWDHSPEVFERTFSPGLACLPPPLTLVSRFLARCLAQPPPKHVTTILEMIENHKNQNTKQNSKINHAEEASHINK